MMNSTDLDSRRRKKCAPFLRMPAPWENCPADILASGDCTPDQRKELEKDILKDNTDVQAYACKLGAQQYRIENRQMFRRLQQEKAERQMQDILCKNEKDRCKRDAQVHQETNFAIALERVKNEKTIKDSMRRQMINATPELRDLERQIKRAYYAKTLYAQRLEGEVLKLECKLRELETNELMQEHIRQYDKKEEEKHLEECMKKRELMKTLKQQIEGKYEQIARQREDELQDKQMVDAIIENIKKEELEDLQERIDRQKLYQSELDAAKRARDEFRRKEKERLEEEERIRQQFVAQKQEQTAKFDQAKAERDARKAGIAAEATKRILEEQYKRAELEELQFILHEEELAEQVRRREAEEAAAREKMRQELQKAAEEAMKLRAEKLEMERKENEEFRRMMMAKFAEDERLEQLSNQKRREKEREHRKKVEEMIIERRARRAEEREREQQMTKCLEAFASEKDEFYEQERLRLLREHGPKLLGYLPRGLIRRQDLQKLGEPFVSYYANLKRVPDPTTVGLDPCEEELFQNLSVSGSNKM